MSATLSLIDVPATSSQSATPPPAPPKGPADAATATSPDAKAVRLVPPEVTKLASAELAAAAVPVASPRGTCATSAAAAAALSASESEGFTEGTCTQAPPARRMDSGCSGTHVVDSVAAPADADRFAACAAEGGLDSITRSASTGNCADTTTSGTMASDTSARVPRVSVKAQRSAERQAAAPPAGHTWPAATVTAVACPTRSVAGEAGLIHSGGGAGQRRSPAPSSRAKACAGSHPAATTAVSAAASLSVDTADRRSGTGGSAAQTTRRPPGTPREAGGRWPASAAARKAASAETGSCGALLDVTHGSGHGGKAS